MMKTVFRAFGLLLLVSVVQPASAAADTCGGVYTVHPGDNLSGIADRMYQDAGKWRAIHNRNMTSIGPRPEGIRVGMQLSLPCLDGQPQGLPQGPVAATPTSVSTGDSEGVSNAATGGAINLLTGDDFAPFTARMAPGGGLLAEVVSAGRAQAAPAEGYAIHWVNDWSSHFDPLLSNALLDLGFPWYKPACDTMPDSYRCRNFFFSEPMFETLMLLFAPKDHPFEFRRDEDIEGKTLCRPAGYLTFDLDQGGRRWVADNKITLLRPHTVRECFELVAAGRADAVAVNEFTGRSVMREHGFEAQFSEMPQPLAVLGLHVVVHKSHPRAAELLDMFDTGLRGIRDSGRYQAILDDHLTRFWRGH